MLAVGSDIPHRSHRPGKSLPQLAPSSRPACSITLDSKTLQVLGKVTQVSFERTIGTLAGGLLGLTTVLLGRDMMQATDQAFTGTLELSHSAVAAFANIYSQHS